MREGWSVLSLIDYDKLEHRLIMLVPGRLAPGFAIGHLLTHLMRLDVAVEDFDAASGELRETMEVQRNVMASFEDLEEAHVALTKSGTLDSLRTTGVRFHYRLDSAYAEARRVLDRVVVVVNELLPRTGTDIGTSHNGFGPRLVSRCEELGLAVPESLLFQIDDLDHRIKGVRDQIEHLTYPVSVRLIVVGEELAVGTRRVVPLGEDAAETQFESAGVLREAIHDYVGAMVDLLETGHRS